MPDQAPQDVTRAARPYPNWYRVAAAIFVANVAVTHKEIARQVGRCRETVARAWHTPGMHQAISEALQGRSADEVAVAAQRAMLRGFAEGRGLPTAYKVLQARGVFPLDRLEVTGADGQPLVPPDMTEQIRKFAARLAGDTVEAPADQAQTAPETAEPGE